MINGYVLGSTRTQSSTTHEDMRSSCKRKFTITKGRSIEENKVMAEGKRSLYNRLCILGMISMVGAVLTADPAVALTIVDNGKAAATIVVPENPPTIISPDRALNCGST